MTTAALTVLDRHAALRDPEGTRAQILSEEGGLLLINKPYADTSFYVVNKLRKAASHATGIKRLKCGHAGTLDPLATGLLILATRRKTKELAHLVGLEKTYVLRMRFGVTSPSFDLEQPIEVMGGEESLTEETVSHAVAALVGAHDQLPPVFSAIKQKGKPVYLKARAGQEVTLTSREIIVHEAELLACALPEIAVRVRVSKGTYIRSLVRDLAATLGTGGLLIDLEREGIAEYRSADAFTVREAVDLLTDASAPSSETAGPTLAEAIQRAASQHERAHHTPQERHA